MFGGYEDIEAFEDDIYCEESSSETSIDSEVEFHLYSQVHYAQALADVSGQEETEGAGPLEKQIQYSVSKQDQKDNFVVISDSDIIQISDSPDVIILSDTPDEDSVYKSKLQMLTTPESPTLERTYNHTDPISVNPSETTLDSKGSSTVTARKEKRIHRKSVSFHRDGVRMIHKILVIEDSSSDENEDEDVTSTVSESDNESWMLLGGARDIRDENILLNLEGCGSSATEGEGGTDWAISDKDLEKVPPCCLCAERGHLQNNCPERFCFNCCLPGHYSRECLERTYWSKHCNRCAMRGHYADACPEIWRQYHLTTKPGPLKKASSFSEHDAPVYCYNCSRRGHYGYECSEKRMFGGTFPTFPFIYYYDNKYDIKRSFRNAKKKVQELQDAGLLPIALKRPRVDDDQKVHARKKKGKLLKEHNRRAEKHHRKKSHADKLKGRKHKKGVQSHCPIEENFPRGGHSKAPKWHKKPSAHFDVSANGDKPEIAKASLEAAKKRKKKKKQDYTVSSSTRDESLFLIKQRKKKSKQKPSI
ncbi:zinc finger CCHC domain-containing protein 7 isoform X2 [Sphaerodactylus townsendi]|uniref:zinc finger CCHC domain-containing protein 7 isoform X2 n=1 Tax=Sphaerodactylus townsendi TaxID=933632 RepID=UPI0020262C7A|nr:zinc finger CCHC domain-containing protein 7 isoform X2 [Sphaerodactylus townsendi]